MDYAALERFRQLADPGHPDYNPAYRDWLAAGAPTIPAPPRPPGDDAPRGDEITGPGCCGDPGHWTKLRGAR